MQRILKMIKNNIRIADNIIILDVDRTIINTTSWYQACISDNLLLSKDNVIKYKTMNDETFKNPSSDSIKELGINTLKMIDEKITKEFIQKIKPLNVSYFKEGTYTNSWRFYIAGKYTALNLVKIYDDVIFYINYLHKYYGNSLNIIFLSAGYQPFIRGVVDGIMEKSNLSNINYTVVGSQIQISNGKGSESFHINQQQKQRIVEHLIKNNYKIRFLADDSEDNLDLFKAVNSFGGNSLFIEHIPNQSYNKTWRAFKSSLTFENVKTAVKNDDSYVHLKQNDSALPYFLQELSRHTDKVGITYTTKDKFKNSLVYVSNLIKDDSDRVSFIEYLNRFIFEKDEKVYLRGKLYYNWLPQYIFIDNRDIFERWKELFYTSYSALCIIYRNKIPISTLNYDERLLLYTIVDHLLESLLFILNLVEQNTLIKNEVIPYNKYYELTKAIQNLMDYMYSSVFNSNSSNDILNKLLSRLNSINLLNTNFKNVKVYKTMRELDNNITIFKFVQSLSKELEDDNIILDYVISFPYGGITLGFALNSYIKVFENISKRPKLLDCHYSSKQQIRENRVEKDSDFSIFDHIPILYSGQYLDILKGEKRILLLDNNVTTFKTLDLCKNFLKQLGNETYSAVAEINYNNITNCLLGNTCEELVPNWRDVLDFHPIGEYLTSFNTWGTSEKTKLLDKLYCNPEITLSIQDNLPVKQTNYIFKVCRVHNIPDLYTVIKNGANMIGIHAVSPDRIMYLNSEARYSPIQTETNLDIELPVPLFEIESIQNMQKYIPSNLKQAILFEKPIDISKMIKTCKLYKVPQDNMYIQLHHRTTQKYIEEIKEKLCKNIIATIGLFQDDFQKYFWMLHNILNKDTDYILIDFSKHQPDLINFSDSYKESINKISVIKHLSTLIQKNTVPVIVADDTSPSQMRIYLDIMIKNHVKVAGIDMQNNVEQIRNEQKYQIFNDGSNSYQIKIRKSPTQMAEWNNFFRS